MILGPPNHPNPNHRNQDRASGGMCRAEASQSVRAQQSILGMAFFWASPTNTWILYITILYRLHVYTVYIYYRLCLYIILFLISIILYYTILHYVILHYR